MIRKAWFLLFVLAFLQLTCLPAFLVKTGGTDQQTEDTQLLIETAVAKTLEASNQLERAGEEQTQTALVKTETTRNQMANAIQGTLTALAPSVTFTPGPTQNSRLCWRIKRFIKLAFTRQRVFQ